MARPSSDKTSPSRSDAEAAKERTTQLLREIRRIEIQTSRLVNQHLAGSYQSVFKGQGVAFSEVRAYTPGDDVRAIDWNVTARTGEPHVKLFTEERELTVMLVVDMSGSLDLGSRDYDKRQLVARLAATFAFSAIRNNDKVGLIGFTDTVEVFVPPRSGRKHVLAVVQQVLTHQPQSRATRVASGLEYLARLGQRHTVAILISDFVDAVPEDSADAARAFEHALKVVRRRHDLIPIRVEDPLELELPALGLVALEDLELLGLGGDTFLDLSPRRARNYRARVEAERTRLDQMLRKLSLDSMSIRCGDNWQQPLVNFFARRARRMRR
ncbi:DUF58 domain-containing protein [Nannocystis sp. SCPEA4]|uniref:DUF58 domain-containing protein n=1 Tax=Nannocystis sp. SCPEA4 TaxID=2996787 RepID=UPI00226D9A90|nr:DUF58 domain-containing protein [Nannocystis sp. SCPEA4]MCY1058432.1 DUF58 domain-containing protein [Nannocystis sp. SCPEA4]